MNTQDALDSIRERIQQETRRRLRFWAFWRYMEDNPGIGYPPENMIAKHMKRSRVFDADTGTIDWSDAIEADQCVKSIQLFNGDAYHAIRARYRYDPEESTDGQHRRATELAIFRRAVGREVSDRMFRRALARGHELMASRLIGGI